MALKRDSLLELWPYVLHTRRERERDSSVIHDYVMCWLLREVQVTRNLMWLLFVLWCGFWGREMERVYGG